MVNCLRLVKGSQGAGSEELDVLMTGLTSGPYNNYENHSAIIATSIPKKKKKSSTLRKGNHIYGSTSETPQLGSSLLI